MARRFSGEIRITIKLDETSPVDAYDCTLSVKGEGHKRVRVLGPVYRAKGTAVDSSEAYDSAAHAALSFAEGEGFPVSEHAATDAAGSGWHIGRDAAHAWPKEDTK